MNIVKPQNPQVSNKQSNMNKAAQSQRAINCDRIYLSLGSNLPFEGIEPVNLLEAACKELVANGFVIEARSRAYHSKAWPIGTDAPDYVNIIISLSGYMGTPFELLSVIQQIEIDFGRKRDKSNQWAPRTIDIDIIDFSGIILDEIQNHRQLTLPHPRAHLRDFVLLPLQEIAPNWVHPVTKQNIDELITHFP